MLDVKQLTRFYGTFKAVDNVSFSIKQGEIVGLLGHNGAGKTTIMKMLSGFLEADHGSIVMDGIDLDTHLKNAQSQIGYLPESLPVYPEMIVADYLDYTADLKGLNELEKKSEIARAVQATDIATKFLDPIATLSRGFKQRVGVAQAILGRPKLLILDEPTNGLDPEQTQHMRELIQDIAKEATVILSTHIMQEVDALCSRVLMLRNGTLAVDEQLSTLRLSNHVILETSLLEAEMSTLKELPEVKNISVIESVPNEIQSVIYRIEMNTIEGRDVSKDLRSFSAKIARLVLSKNHEVYRLMQERHDLETLFREVNEQSYLREVASHAA